MLITITWWYAMNTAQTLQVASQLDWGTVPQWLTFIGVVVGFAGTIAQLRHQRSVRETENILNILESTAAHNVYFKDNGEAARAVQVLEGLSAPASEPEARTYWATRDVHYGHLSVRPQSS
jgi:hypothetical protein